MSVQYARAIPQRHEPEQSVGGFGGAFLAMMYYRGCHILKDKEIVYFLFSKTAPSIHFGR